MEAFNTKEAPAPGPGPRVKASIKLGSQTYCIGSSDEDVRLSAALSSTKDEIMGILKEYIASQNVPDDVLDEVDVSEGDDEEEDVGIPEKPRVRSKKTKLG